MATFKPPIGASVKVSENSLKLNDKTEDQLSVATATNAINFNGYDYSFYALSEHVHDSYVKSFDTIVKIESMSLNSPPETPIPNGIYMVNGTGTGAWSSFVDKELITYYPNTNVWKNYAYPYNDVV